MRFGMTAALVVLLAGLVAARPTDPGLKDYVRTIGEAQAALKDGKIADARRKLDATGAKHRSFEFDYLTARAQAAKDGAAPDLIQTLKHPEDVETRFGVLDEVNRRLVFICRDGAPRIHDMREPAVPPNVGTDAGGNPCWSGAFSRDGTTFVSGHQNGDVNVWDTKTWRVRQRLSVGDSPVRELAIAPDGSALVAEGAKELELWALGKEPKKVASVGERYNFGEGLAFSPKGDLIATGGMFAIQLYDARTGAQKNQSMQHASYTMGLEFSPDGQRIASAPRGNVNKFFAVFNVADGKQLFNAGPFAHYVAGMAFTPDGKRVAATGCEKLLRIFDAETGEVVLTFDRPSCGSKPAFSRDGRFLGWSEPEGYRYIDLGKP